MLEKTIGLVLLTGTALAAEPFIMMRMTRAPAKMPEKMQQIIAVNAANPGSADAYWFAYGAGQNLANCEEFFKKLLPFKEPAARAGIAFDFQQGVTFGHGDLYNPKGPKPEGTVDLPDDAWQVTAGGRQTRLFCPTSPEALAYEEAWIASLCRILKPGAVWLDDDLRLGYCKDDGCFCPRCLAAFNARFGHAFTREELNARLFKSKAKEPVRRDWFVFLGEQLARYGAAARRGADRVDPACRIAYQSVNANKLRAHGQNLTSLLRALSGDGRTPTAIRIGSLCYRENAHEISEKMIMVAREAARCRTSGVKMGQIAYEQENYTRQILNKSAEASLVESALALASGCDSLSEYRWDGNRDEPLSDYVEFAGLVSAWRPYLLRVAALSPVTTLGGVARFIGSDYDVAPAMDLTDERDMHWADMGVPVTVAESGTRTFYVDAVTLAEWGADDAARLFAPGVGCVVDTAVYADLRAKAGAALAAAEKAGRVKKLDFKTYGENTSWPTTSQRATLLDALDAVGPMPVRVDRAHHFRLFPRVSQDGRTVAITIWNESSGKSFPTLVRIRKPAGRRVTWARPEAADVRLAVTPDVNEDEIHVTIPSLPARQVGTIFLSAR